MIVTNKNIKDFTK